MPARQRSGCAAWLALALVATSGVRASAQTPTAQAPAPQRALSVDDLLRTELLGYVGWLGDAPLLEHAPALIDRPFYQTGIPWAAARILTSDHPGGPLRPFFPHREGSGYSIASVSPDRKRVLLREITARSTSVVLVEAGSGASRVIAPTPFNDHQDKGFAWIADTEFLFSVRDVDDEHLPMRHIHVAADALGAAWSATRTGRAGTATVVSSRSLPAWPRPLAGQLLHFDVAKSRASAIADGVYLNHTISPSGRFVSALRRGEYHATRPRDGAMTPLTNALTVLRLHGADRAEVKEACPDCEVVAESIQWASGSDELYFYAKPRFASWRDGAFHRYRAEQDALERIDLRGLDWSGWEYFPSPLFSEPKPYPLAPLATGVAVLARDPDQPDGGRWMFLPRTGGPAVNLGDDATRFMGAALATRGDCIAARSDSALWKLCAGARAVNLTRKLGDVTAVVTPEQAPAFGPAPAERNSSIVTVELRKGETRAIYNVDPMSGNTHRLATLSKTESVRSISPTHSASIIVDAAPSGSAVLLASADRRSELIRLNAHFREIRWPRAHKITYQAEGETLSSCVWRLPGDAGAPPPPIVVSVYPDVSSRKECEHRGGPGFGLDSGLPDTWSPNYLASLGYAVVMPATPHRLLNAENEASARLTALVEAAIDATGREGLGDVSRVGLFGVSQGGYSALKVLTQTTRFRAAIAGFSQSDYASDYGDVHMVDSIAPTIHGWGDKAVWYQADNGLVAPDAPWRRPEWFLRSSPYMHADKIATPLMLVGADLDTFASLNQFSMMFTALWHERRDVDFVRYWGEGHWLENPHNLRDFDARVRAWFGALVKGDGKLPPPGNQLPTNFDGTAPGR